VMSPSHRLRCLSRAPRRCSIPELLKQTQFMQVTPETKAGTPVKKKKVIAIDHQADDTKVASSRTLCPDPSHLLRFADVEGGQGGCISQGFVDDGGEDLQEGLPCEILCYKFWAVHSAIAKPAASSGKKKSKEELEVQLVRVALLPCLSDLILCSRSIIKMTRAVAMTPTEMTSPTTSVTLCKEFSLR